MGFPTKRKMTAPIGTSDTLSEISISGGLHGSLRWSATNRPQSAAIVSAERAFSYEELWGRVNRVANSLQSLGLRSGDRIALLMQNSHRYLEIYHAAALLGAAVVPLNFRCIATEIEYIVNHSGADTVVFDVCFAEAIVEARSRLPTVQHYVCADGRTADAFFYEDLVEAGIESQASVGADRSAIFFQGYTSGTTGAPKGCVVPQGEFVECLQKIASLYGIDACDVELVVAPLFHEAPVIFALLQHLRGGTVVITKDGSPANICEQIQRNRVTWAFMVPTMWHSLVHSAELDRAELNSMRVLLSGGAPLLTQTKRLLLERLPAAGLHEFYGGTELGLVTNLEPRDQRRKERCVGKPVPGRVVELRDAEGRSVSRGEVGEIYVSGDILLKEYFKNPEATAAARAPDGFFTLGDMGRFDDEGYLYIVDRKKDMIISGGEASEQELIAHCKTWLSSFKVPKKIDFYQELPMSPFGKVLRREVRRRYWTSSAIQV